ISGDLENPGNTGTQSLGAEVGSWTTSCYALKPVMDSLKPFIYLGAIFATHILVDGALRTFRFSSLLSKDPGFVAHQFCFLLVMLYSAVYGCWLWANRSFMIEDRIYDYQEGAVILAKLNFAFQIYDLVISMSVKTLRKPDRVAHHFITAILAFWSYHYNLCLYYSIFFFGVSEVSSVFLTFVEFFKEFPSLRDEAITPMLFQFNEISRMMFAGLFLSIRVVYWPYVSMQFWGDALDALTEGRPYPFELVCTLMANIGLTILQFYWGVIILKQIRRKLFTDRPIPIISEGHKSDCEYGTINNHDDHDLHNDYGDHDDHADHDDHQPTVEQDNKFSLNGNGA
ncbi:hypothetical protein AAMO2058_000747500, partial [Amorphochlora amoebiformis]